MALAVGLEATAVAVTAAVHPGWVGRGAAVIHAGTVAVAVAVAAVAVGAASAGALDGTAATEAEGTTAEVLTDGLVPTDPGVAVEVVAFVVAVSDADAAVVVDGAAACRGTACEGISGDEVLPSHHPRPNVRTIAPATRNASSAPRVFGGCSSSNVGNVGSCRRYAAVGSPSSGTMVGGGGCSVTDGAAAIGASTSGGAQGGSAATGGAGCGEAGGGAMPAWVVLAATGADGRGAAACRLGSVVVATAAVDGRGAGGGARPIWVVLLGGRSRGAGSSMARDRLGFFTSEMRATAASFFTTGGGASVATIEELEIGSTTSMSDGPSEMGSPDDGGADSSADSRAALRARILAPKCLRTKSATTDAVAILEPAIRRTVVAIAAADGHRSSGSTAHARHAISVSGSAHFASAGASARMSRKIAPAA